MASRCQAALRLAVGLAALAASCAAGERPVLQALRESLAGVPVGAPALETEPAGEVTLDYAPTARPVAVLAEAQRLEQEGDWRGAAALYQRLIGEAPDSLCRPSPRLYVPLRVHAEERLARFPAEGLRAYRELVDGPARRLYDEARASRDAAKLSEVASRYLLSSVGDNALDMLATRWLARGECGRALRAWGRLVRLCGDTDVDLLTVAAKAAVCQRRLGRAADAHDLLSRVASVAGRDAAIPLGGQRTSLAAFPSRLPELTTPGTDRTSWPVEGGDRSQARTAPTAVRPGKLQWSDVLLSRGAVEAALTAPDARDPFGIQRRREPSVLVAPIVADGLVIYPSRLGLLARGLETGKVAWSLPWPRHQGGRLMLPPFTLAPSWPGRWSASAGGGRVFVSVALVAPSRRETQTGGELLAVDARSGEVAWRRPAPLDLPQTMESGWYDAPPLPCGDRLVVGLRAGPTGEESHLLGLRARDGRRLWRTFLCSRMGVPWYTAGSELAWFGAMAAESEGLAVLCPGGGVVGAVEVATGRVRWLARYDQLPSGRYGYYPRSGWRSHTPVIAGGVVYATPPDAESLCAFDLTSGRLLWQREREGHRHLVAVRDGRVYLAGRRATCLTARGETEWETALPTAVVAKPVLAGRILHLPVAGGILYLDTTTGAELAWTGWTDWERTSGPTYTADVASGDLRVVANRLLVTTPFTINVFAPHLPQRDLETAVVARGEDPAAHLALGQELHWQGDVAKAAAQFEQALALADRASPAFAADVHRRLASCYADMSQRHERADRLDAALKANRRALAHAADPDRRAKLRLREAHLARRLRRWDVAAAALQTVLADAPAQGPLWTAARDAVAALLDDAGRAPYDAFDRAADKALGKGTEDELKTIVRAYPNSRAAPLALLRLAETADAAAARQWLYRVPRDYPASPHVPAALHRLARGYAALGARPMARGALAVLRQRYPDWRPGGDDALEPDAFLAEHAPKTPAKPVAALSLPLEVGWQTRPDYGAAELHVVSGDADALFLLAGLSLECRSARDGSLRWADRPGWIGIYIEDARRPGGGVLVRRVVPDTPGDRAGLRGGDVILGFGAEPIRDSQQLIAVCSARRAGAAVNVQLLRDGEQVAIPVTLGARPWQATDAHLGADAFLGTAGDHAFLRQPTRLDAIRREAGGAAWSIDLDDPGQEGPTALAAPGLVVAADSRGRLIALDPARGHELWRRRLDEPTVHRVLLWEYGLVAATASPATVRVLNPFDGTTVFQTADRHATGTPLVALDSRTRLCYAMGSTLGCYDGAAGHALWRDRVANFTAKRLWADGPVVVAHGSDHRGQEALECRRIATGGALWARSMARGETLQRLALDGDALYAVTRRAARALARRLDSSTGEAVWTRELATGEDFADWEPSAAALCLGVTATDERGEQQAQLVAIDKLTGAVRQIVPLGPGQLKSLSRVADALYAVVEDNLFEQRARFGIAGIHPGEPLRFRIVRILATP